MTVACQKFVQSILELPVTDEIHMEDRKKARHTDEANRSILSRIYSFASCLCQTADNSYYFNFTSSIMTSTLFLFDVLYAYFTSIP